MPNQLHFYINGSQDIDYSQYKNSISKNSFLSAIDKAGLVISGPEKADFFISINRPK